MAPAPSTDSSPYVGPRPFSASDGAEFFGRDQEIAELLSLVVANRVVLLYAVSGAGKTSLLTAGLDAALTDHGFEVFPPLRFQTPIPPPDAARNVFVYAALWALAHRGGVEGPSSPDEMDLEMTLESFLAGLPRETDAYGFERPRVLIFDQFEEIFTSYQQRWPDREAFVRQLAAALAGDVDLRVIFSLREEYVAQIDRYAGLLPNGLRARFHLERLRQEAALLAVRGPLRRRGIQFAPGVAETLIHDLQETRIDLSTVGSDRTAIVQGEFVEPVHLQVVCSTLWSRLDPAVAEVTHQDVEALGGVDDSLENYYDDAIAAALGRAPVAEHKLRAALERALITPAGTRATVFASTEEISGMPAAALDELARRHLIRAEWRSGGRWLELAHDRLITTLRQSNARVLDLHRRRVRRRLRAGAAAAMILTLAVALSLTVAGSPRVQTVAKTVTFRTDRLTKVDRPILLGSRPNSITFANDSVWVLSARSPDIALLDAKTSSRIRPIPIGLGATAVAAGFRSVWVVKGNTRSLIRLNRTGDRNGSTQKIQAAGMPVAVVAGEHAVWVGVRDGRDGTLVRVNRDDLTQQRSIQIPGGLQDIAVGKGAVWVTTISGDSVVRVDANDVANTKEIRVGKQPKGVAVGQGAIWVANSGSDSITPINPRTRSAGRDVLLQFSPTRIATGGGSVWATAKDANALIRIDPQRRTVREEIQTGRQPYALVVTSGHAVWVTLLNGNGVQRVHFVP